MAVINLTVDDEKLARAEQLARMQGTTVEAMLHRLIDVVGTELNPEALPPITRSALGSLPSITDEEADAIIEEEMMRKFGRA